MGRLAACALQAHEGTGSAGALPRRCCAAQRQSQRLWLAAVRLTACAAQESFQKALRSLETGYEGWTLPRRWRRRTQQELEYEMRVPNPGRMMVIKQARPGAPPRWWFAGPPIPRICPPAAGARVRAPWPAATMSRCAPSAHLHGRQGLGCRVLLTPEP